MNDQSSTPQRDLGFTACILTVLLAIGFATVLAAAPDRTSAAVLWCLGCAITGFIVGFLFGFPRVVADDRPPRVATTTLTAEPADTGTEGAAGPRPGGLAYRLAINTNLEQVSDWLTKIIVGVGLVELRNVPGYARRAGRYFGAGIGGPAENAQFNERLATMILLFFGSLGLLAGYLLTRMFFSAAFRRADVGTIGASDARAIAETPLEREGQKVELAVAATAVSGRLRRADRQEVAGSLEALAAWARLQFDSGKYEDAIDAYQEAIGMSPRNARLRLSYAIALKYGRRSLADVLQQLEKARQLARAAGDTGLRRDVYASYTFNSLYLKPPDAFNRAREAAIEYVENSENLPSGDVLFNLACAYGQQYAWETRLGQNPDAELLKDLRQKAKDALEDALNVSPQLIPRAQQLLEGLSPGDDDLEPFGKDSAFRALAGLSAR